MRLTCGISSFLVDDPCFALGKELSLGLWMAQYHSHRIGHWDRHWPLSSEGSRLMRPCPSGFNPSTHLVVGELCYFPPGAHRCDRDENWCHVIADCGVPVELTRRFTIHPPDSAADHRLWGGGWAAALGDLYLNEAADPVVPRFTCKLSNLRALDMNPQSSAFGTLVPWDGESTLVHDPDVIRFPTMFVDVEVVDVPSFKDSQMQEVPQPPPSYQEPRLNGKKWQPSSRATTNKEGQQ